MEWGGRASPGTDGYSRRKHVGGAVACSPRRMRPVTKRNPGHITTEVAAGAKHVASVAVASLFAKCEAGAVASQGS